MATSPRWLQVLLGAAVSLGLLGLTTGAGVVPPASPASPAAAPVDEPVDDAPPPPPVSAGVRIDFTDFGEGTIEQWLKGKGFDFEYGAQSRREIGLAADAEGLKLTALKRTRGFFVRDGEDVGAFRRVKIEWGVKRYPDGACYSCESYNEALMVYVFFGRDKLYSGGFGVPNAPYFLGLYLNRTDERNVPYKGRYYHRGGRFICVGGPEHDQRLVSELDLESAFNQAFDLDQLPPISGFALGVDTTDSGDRGQAEAFIKSLEFLP